MYYISKNMLGSHYTFTKGRNNEICIFNQSLNDSFFCYVQVAEILSKSIARLW